MKRAAKDENFGKPNAGDEEPKISNTVTIDSTSGKFSKSYPLQAKLSSSHGRVMNASRSMVRDPRLPENRHQNLPSHSQPSSSENGCRCC